MSEALKAKLSSVGRAGDYHVLEQCPALCDRLPALMHDCGPAVVGVAVKLLHYATHPTRDTDQHYAQLFSLLSQHGLDDAYAKFATSGISVADLVTWINQFGPRIVAVVEELWALVKQVVLPTKSEPDTVDMAPPTPEE